MGGLFAQEAATGFSLFPIAVIALRRRRQVYVAACRHANIALRCHVSRLRGYVAPCEDHRIPPAGNLRTLLTNRFVNGGFFLRLAAGAFHRRFREQVHIPTGLNAHIVFRRYRRRTGIHVVTCLQGEVTARAQGAALMRDGRRLRGRAVAPGAPFAGRDLVGGDVDIIPRRHTQAATRRHVCAGHVDILSGAHRQPVGGGDGGRLADIGATEMHISRIDIPLLCAGDVVNAARDALQPYRFAADGGSDVIDIPQRAQVKPAACAQQSGVEVAQAVAAVD